MEKIPTHSMGQCKPKITYPCLWEYKIIATGRESVRSVIDQHLGDVPYSLTDSHASSGGRYVSMKLEVTVYSDFHRIRLYEAFTEHPDVKVVL